jgi:large subunit ribosomal protein L24
MNIKKGDQVTILSGNYKGKKGKVIKAFPKEGKIVVEKVNIVKKHLRPRKQGEQGQIIETERPIDASNAMVICPKCSKPTRIGVKITKTKKQRICKNCNKEL